ncbi:hypothetical protein [Knoellia koreensis]|uniref:Pilus assembly protein FlpE n=1 Tax=Knoellia koreensis TaxID=2730921 RepID=A0A849HL70_9MICO|nr:hypothetical protein [Knoellia sp. DB2414S]NNM47111.1 hypothetical protein [Knoellia sp. DB2414S]
MVHTVVGVVGASGGLGASTLAVALAVRASLRSGLCVAVDAEPDGGLDVTAGVEHLPGLRWPDLAASRGGVDGAALLADLPGQDSVRVLSGGGVARAPGSVESGLERGALAEAPAATRRQVVAALAEVCALTVLDLGRHLDLVDLCTDVVVVSGTTARQLADATALCRGGVLDLGRSLVVLRTTGREGIPAREVADHLGLPLAGVLGDDPRVRRDEVRAVMPGSRARGVVAGAADRLLDLVAGRGHAAYGVGA